MFLLKVEKAVGVGGVRVEGGAGEHPVYVCPSFEKENVLGNGYLFPHVHSRIIHNSLEVATPHMSTDR